VWLGLALRGQAEIVFEFFQQPSNVVIHPCRDGRFSVMARATEDGIEIGPLAYQWQGQPLGSLDWTDVAGATNAGYVPSPPWSSSPGSFRCKVAAREQMATSAAAELTLDATCLRPAIMSAVGLVPQNRTVVRFSDPMDPITTMDSFNYRAGPNLEFAPVQVFLPDAFTAVLEWDSSELQLQLGLTYRLRVDLVAAYDAQCLCNFIVDAQLDFKTELAPQIDVLEHPLDKIDALGNLATFSANARGTSNGMVLPVRFQWQQYSEATLEWANIEGATNATYTMLVTKCTATPLLFRCRFQVGYTFAFSHLARLTVVADCSPLRVVSAVGDVRQNAIVLQFSELVDPDTALDLFNYEFVSGPDPVLPVIESVHLTNLARVVLVLSASTPLRNGSNYALSIMGVGDLSDPACGCKFIDPGTVISFPAIRECMRITQQPASLDGVEGCAATFGVGVRWFEGPAPLQYQWVRDGAIIPGATNQLYTVESVRLTDQGAGFSVVLSSSCQVLTSKVATLNVRASELPPVVLWALPGPAADTIVIEFFTSCSGPGGGLQPDLAVDPANYVISGDLRVRAVALDCDGRRVHLITSPQAPDANYFISLKNLADRLGNVMPENSRVTIAAPFRTPLTPGKMRVSANGYQMFLEWASGGILQVSDLPTGPWVDVANQSSPTFVTPSPYACNGVVPASQRFYRVRWDSP
jgi:hypothetical protein